MGITLKFSGEIFKQASHRSSKTDAKNVAQRKRNIGLKARVTNFYMDNQGERKKGYGIWVRMK